MIVTPNNALRWLILVLAPLTLIPFAVFTLFTIWVFETGLLPEYERKATTVGIGIKEQVEYATGLGIPLDQLRDVTAFLDDVRADNEQIGFIAVTAANGRLLFHSSQPPERLDQIVATSVLEARTPMDAEARDAMRVDQMSAPVALVEQAYRTLTGAGPVAETETASPRIGDFYVTTLPIEQDGGEIGVLHVGVGIDVLQRLTEDLVFDTATVFLAALVVAVEFLLLVFAIHIVRPMRLLSYLSRRIRARDLREVVLVDSRGTVSQLVLLMNHLVVGVVRRMQWLAEQAPALPAGRARRDASQAIEALQDHFLTPPDASPRRLRLPALDYIRLPLFLFFLGEAIIRPILPSFMADMPNTLGGISSEAAIGIPFAAFMAASILGVVIGSWAAERSNVRIVLLAGGAIACAALAGHMLAQDLMLATLFRAASGIGYGLVYAAAQVFVVNHSRRSARARGFSVFLASVVAAEICGPPIGGIIADRLGIDMTFAIGSLVLAGSLIAVYMLVDGRKPDVDATATGVDAEPQERLGFAQGIARLVAHPRFALLTLLYAVPAKMLLTGAVFILVPLAAVEMGATTPEIGRILMIYGIAILLTGPIFARFADRLGSFGFNIALGGLLSGLGLVLVGLYPSLVTLSIAVLMIGLGQSLSIPSQLTFTLDVTETVVRRLGPGQVLGVFRLFERIGSLLGPLIAAALLAITQASSEALLYFGLFSLITAWIASLAFLILGTRNERDALTDYFGEETRHAET